MIQKFLKISEFLICFLIINKKVKVLFQKLAFVYQDKYYGLRWVAWDGWRVEKGQSIWNINIKLVFSISRKPFFLETYFPRKNNTIQNS